ncbi:MAG: ABC transporter substrate-binding protein [bacterium]|jgi:ABC-type amino acid transport substrate-binding protein
MRKGFLLVCLGVMVACLAGCGKQNASVVETKDTLQKIIENGKIVVGVRARFPPIGQINPATNEIEGLVIDLINFYAQQLGVKVELRNVEWAALIPGLTNKDFDMLACHMTRTVARTASIALSDPFFLTGTTAIIPAASKLTTWSDLNSKDVSIGITEGNVYINVIEKNFPNAKMVTFAGKIEWTEALKAGRISCVLDSELAGRDMMKLYPGVFKLLPDDFLDTETYGFSFRYGDWGFKNSLDLFLQEIKQNGKYGEIYKKWMGMDWKPSTIANAL